MMADDHDQQPGEEAKSSPAVEPAQTPLDQMQQTVDDEKRGIEELEAKIQEAKEHEKQLRRD
jgi:hypothetical protein